MEWVEAKPYSRDPRDTKEESCQAFLGTSRETSPRFGNVRTTQECVARKPIKFSLVDASVHRFLSLVDLQVQRAP